MSGSRMIHLSLLGLAALGGLAEGAWGQSYPSTAPPATPPPLGGVVRPSDVVPPTVPPGVTLHDCPAKGCCTPKICVPDVQVKTVTTVCYGMKCKTICTPTCWFCLGKDCCKCGKPREIHVLMKRFVPQQQCVKACVPVAVPVCCDDCAVAGGVHYSPPGAAPLMIAPAAPPTVLPARP